MNNCLFEHTHDVMGTLNCKGVCQGDFHKCPAQRAKAEEEIRQWYPLFQFEFCRHLDEKKYGPHWCIIHQGHRSYFNEEAFWSYHEMRTRFKSEHRIKATKKRLKERYKNLEIYIEEDRFGAIVGGVWVRHDGYKAAAIKWLECGMYLDDPDLHSSLEHANEQAELALQTGWFYCTAHGQAEEGERYGARMTFQYCQEAAEKHGWRAGQSPMTGD